MILFGTVPRALTVIGRVGYPQVNILAWSDSSVLQVAEDFFQFVDLIQHASAIEKFNKKRLAAQPQPDLSGRIDKFI